MTTINLRPNATPLICILGATATGKTRLGVSLARTFGGEIISADSRQVYRGLDIGSGKDLKEYAEIPYHLIDIAEPGYEFNLFEFVEAFNAAFEDISARNKVPFLVGGTGMYLDAVLNHYKLTRSNSEFLQQHLNIDLEKADDESLRTLLQEINPKLHNSTDLEDRHRLIKALEIAVSQNTDAEQLQVPQMNTLTIGIHLPREEIRKRITTRLRDRLEQGMIEEVETLHASGVAWEQLEFYGLEYRFVAQYLQGQLNKNDMFQKLNSAIHQFAKQQEKWFRNIQKKGRDIVWIEHGADLETKAAEVVGEHLGL